MNDTIGIEQIVPRIRLMMHELTEKEQQIVRYCLSMGKDLNQQSIQEVAGHNNVSPAMIIKVAHRCGFSGYKEMKNSLVAYSQLPVVDLHEELNPNDDASTVVEKVFNTAINAIEETLAIIDVEAVATAADALKKATNIDFYGVGGSGALALDAYHKFLRIGLRTNVCIDSHLILMSANLLREGDVALGFSHSGRTRALVEAFAFAQKKGATTIAITNTPHSPLARYTDILLCSVAQGSPITGESAAARIVQLNILDALFVLVAQANYEQSLANLEMTINSVSSHRVI